MSLKVKKDGVWMATAAIPRGSSTVTGEIESGCVPDDVHMCDQQDILFVSSH